MKYIIDICVWKVNWHVLFLYMLMFNDIHGTILMKKYTLYSEDFYLLFLQDVHVRQKKYRPGIIQDWVRILVTKNNINDSKVYIDNILFNSITLYISII